MPNGRPANLRTRRPDYLKLGVVKFCRPRSLTRRTCGMLCTHRTRRGGKFSNKEKATTARPRLVAAYRMQPSGAILNK